MRRPQNLKNSPTCFDKTVVFTQQRQNKWEIFSNFYALLRKAELYKYVFKFQEGQLYFIPNFFAFQSRFFKRKGEKKSIFVQESPKLFSFAKNIILRSINLDQKTKRGEIKLCNLEFNICNVQIIFIQGFMNLLGIPISIFNNGSRIFQSLHRLTVHNSTQGFKPYS